MGEWMPRGMVFRAWAHKQVPLNSQWLVLRILLASRLTIVSLDFYAFIVLLCTTHDELLNFTQMGIVANYYLTSYVVSRLNCDGQVQETDYQSIN